MKDACSQLSCSTGFLSANSGVIEKYRCLQPLLTIDRPHDFIVARDLNNNVVTWAEWTRLVAQIERQITADGLGAWAVFCEDSLFAGAALFALWRSGCVAWMPGNIASETRAALECNVIGWISDTGLFSKLPVIDPRVDNGKAITSHNCHTPMKNVALYVYTSGSTGDPKAIPKNFSQLQAEIDNLQGLWGNRLNGTTLLASVSHQHFYGLLFRLLWPLCSGTPILRDTIQYPEQWFAASRHFQPVSWVASPALYKRMKSSVDWAALESCINVMFSSGGALPSQTAQFLYQQLKQPVVEVFGSSETGGVGWRLADGVNYEKFSAETDQPDGYEETDIKNAWTCFDGVTISLSLEGALMIKSRYLPDAHLFEMSDRAKKNSSSCFQLLERLDRIVKIEEKRVSLPQLERHLAQHPWVQEAFMLSLAQPGGREFIGAVVTLRSDFPVSEAASRKQLVDTLRNHMALVCEAVIVPKKWRFVTEIPSNSQGKRSPQEIAKLFDDETPVLRPEVLHIEHIQTSEAKVAMVVPGKLTYFEGHFDKGAILPGVVQVGWAWQLAHTYWSLPQHFSDLEVLKFQRVIVPLQIVQLSLRYDEAKQKLYFQYSSSKGPHSSGRIVLKNSASTTSETEA